jgi:chaperonin GroEL
VTLINASQNLSVDTVGSAILFKALQAPAIQIGKNAGIEIDISQYKGNVGLNTDTRTYVDMLEAGVVNPCNVEVNAVRNAISVAATALSAPTITTLPHENQAL